MLTKAINPTEYGLSPHKFRLHTCTREDEPGNISNNTLQEVKYGGCSQYEINAQAPKPENDYDLKGSWCLVSG